MVGNLVVVFWIDSRSPTSGWQFADPDEVNTQGPVECMSAGFVLRSDKSVICLAPNVGDLGAETKQVSGVIEIPVRCITSIRNIGDETCPAITW